MRERAQQVPAINWGLVQSVTLSLPQDSRVRQTSDLSAGEAATENGWMDDSLTFNREDGIRGTDTANPADPAGLERPSGTS